MIYRLDPNQDRAAQAAFDGYVPAERVAALVSLLKEVREACLYVDDDGTVCVSEDAVIPCDLFGRICDAINPDRTK